MTAIQDGGTLTITGDAHANDVQILDDGTDSGLTVTVDGAVQTLSGDPVTDVVIKTRAGADTVSYTLTGDYTVTRSVDVWLGNGNDTFTADLGHAIQAGSSFTLQVHGGNGKDDLSATGTGSVAGTLDVELFGQNGMDVVSYDYTGDVVAGGSVKLNVDGGNGKDDLSFHYAGLVDGSLDVTVSGGNGMDSFDGDLSASGGAGTVTAGVLGGNGKDDLTLSLTVDPTATLSPDVSIDGGHGKDTITTTGDVTVVDAAKN